MEKTHKTVNGIDLWELRTDADHILHRIGSNEYNKIHRATVSNPDDWEELPMADIPPYTEAQYKGKVVALIREKYDYDDECAILRQRDTKPEEFVEYYDYVEQCKQTAKITLSREEASE